MTAKDIAAGLAQALGSGKTGALAIGGSAAGVTAAIQDKLNSEFNGIGALVGRYGGTSFTDAIASGATRGAVETQSDLTSKGLMEISKSPYAMPLGLAALAIIAAWVYNAKS